MKPITVADRPAYDKTQTWFIELAPGSKINMNPTHKNNQGCAESPGPFGCLICPLDECTLRDYKPKREGS